MKKTLALLAAGAVGAGTVVYNQFTDDNLVGRVAMLAHECSVNHLDVRQIIAVAEGQDHVEPNLLLAVAVKESCLDPNAKSPGGAFGITQVIPKWHGEKILFITGDTDSSALFNPEVGLKIGAMILGENIAATGTVPDGLKAYNRGLYAWQKDKSKGAGYSTSVLKIKARIDAAQAAYAKIKQLEEQAALSGEVTDG